MPAFIRSFPCLYASKASSQLTPPVENPTTTLAAVVSNALRRIMLAPTRLSNRARILLDIQELVRIEEHTAKTVESVALDEIGRCLQFRFVQISEHCKTERAASLGKGV